MSIDLRGVARHYLPDNVDSEIFDVIEFADYTGDITQAVTIGVFEAGGIDLVDYAVFPPDPICDGHDCGCVGDEGKAAVLVKMPS
jgi:hypothetical protein